MFDLLPKNPGQVLGQNARALWYTEKVNTSQEIKLAKSKLATKRALQKAGLPTPRLFAVIRSHQELKRFKWTKLPGSFVVKPNSSYGGGGIIVVFGRNKKGNWITAEQTEIFIPQLINQVLDILDGNFSQGNIPDTALFEQRVKNHPDLKHYSVRGIPDIRILAYNYIPVMAMLRLPTLASRGKANLHAGGIGVGIDLAQGMTTTAIHHGRLIEILPGTQSRLGGIRLPHWKETLLIATKAAQALGLHFAGVDIALDREEGPVVLEINARPGLEIQLANMAPLRSRLRRIEGLTIHNPEKRVQLGQSLFSSELEHEIEDISGRTILGIIEPVEIMDSNGNPHTIMAKVDTGAWRTTIDNSLAQSFGLHTNIIEERNVWGALGQQTRPVIELSLVLHNHPIKTKAFLADRSRLNYDMIIGRRDLKGFLVDPTKNPPKKP
jgi:alpha-L-glutamate ligase-like protein